MDISATVAPKELYLVERYWPGVTEPELRSAVSKIGVALSEMALGGVPVRYLRSTLVPGEESVLCLFEGRSADDVAEANRRAGVRFDRISLVIDVSAEGKRPSNRPRR
jgi:hypothetical protein